jgi:hypothetical protein
MLFRRRADPGRPSSGPPAQQVEREAYLGLLAGAAGVRTPRVVLAGPYGNGSGLLVQRMIPGRSLEDAGPADVGDDGRPWLVDFDHATAAAPERLRQADLVELLVSLAASFGPDRALAGAVEAFGRDPLAAALAAVTPHALTRTTREELDDAPGLWEELARGSPPPVAEPSTDGDADAEVRRRSSGPSR